MPRDIDHSHPYLLPDRPRHHVGDPADPVPAEPFFADPLPDDRVPADPVHGDADVAHPGAPEPSRAPGDDRPGPRRRSRHREPAGAGVNRRTVIAVAGSGALLSACGATVAKVAPKLTSDAVGALLGAVPRTSTAGGPAAVAAAAAPVPAVGIAGPRAATTARRVRTGTAGSSTVTDHQVTDHQVTGAGRSPAMRTSSAAIVQPPTVLSLDQTLHLARRAAWGPTPQLLAQIRAAGAGAWIDRQLRPATIPDPASDAALRQFDTLDKTPAQLKAMNPTREQADYFYATTQLEQAAIARAAWSERQLLEVMVDFLNNKLHVPGHFDKSRDLLNHYDANVIRRYAFGRFSDLVWAMVTHPAMIFYLDNQSNTRYGGNQNLGRELMELHTLGVDAGYSQRDVAGSAQLLTGLGVTDDGTAMQFHPDQHYVGLVTVFGRTYPNATAAGGLATIRTYIHDLTHHPATAHHFCLDLARRLVSDSPPTALVERMAAAYLAGDTAMAPLVKLVLTSAEFKASIGQKYRRPFENAAATVRALGLTAVADPAKVDQSLLDLRYTLDQLGQTPLGHTSPDGFPDIAQPWLSSMGTLGRWNLQFSLAGGWRDGLSRPAVAAIIARSATYGQAVDALAARLLFGPVTRRQRAALLAFLGKSATTALTPSDRANDYNLLVRLPALILGSPAHQLR